MAIKIYRSDFLSFRCELERAILATDQEELNNYLTRAKFLAFLLSRLLGYTYIEMFDQTYNLAVLAANAESDKKEKVQAFRQHFSTIKYELSVKNKFY
ncbi:TPA: hypothetical protein MEH73_005570 [Klebsiella pneumoniae]|nr:hypothetical protein [Klebsiella pneumoniae]HDQ3433213.1 hypothetical protein [Klebsiella pneumoniae]